MTNGFIDKEKQSGLLLALAILKGSFPIKLLHVGIKIHPAPIDE